MEIPIRQYQDVIESFIIKYAIKWIYNDYASTAEKNGSSLSIWSNIGSLLTNYCDDGRDWMAR